MSPSAKLPAVRLPSVLPSHSVDGETTGQDPLVVELPPSDKFSFAWPSGLVPPVPPPIVNDRPTSLSSSDAESGPSESEFNIEDPVPNAGGPRTGSLRKPRHEDADEYDFTPTNRLYTEQNPMDQALPPSLPRLSRAFSVPLPAQIGYLKNPRRPLSNSGSGPPTPILEDSPQVAQLHELSLELADHVQMVIQTLLQLSPPQVFDPAKEQFSACSLPIPTPSITAMFTSMKNLNYMSANMAAFSAPSSSSASADTTPTCSQNGDPSPCVHSPTVLSREYTTHDFDIGETLQSVGDTLSGLAADVGVDLVLFHGDLGMKHVAVKGDESGISYTLSHIVRQILATAHRGDSLEIGLFIVAPLSEAEVPTDVTESASPTSLSPDPTMPLVCTFTITHVFAPPPSPRIAYSGTRDQASPLRSEPFLRSNILLRLLRHIDAKFACEMSNTTAAGRSCKLTFTLERGSPAVVNPAVILSEDDPVLQSLPGFNIAGEPTLEELAQFVETLRGKKVSLYASSKGQFAQHLTSYLTAWGLDVSPISAESDGENLPDKSTLSDSLADTSPPAAEASSGAAPTLDALSEQSNGSVLPTTTSGASPAPSPPSFILIDDDVSVLREQLRNLLAEQQYPLHIGSRKRPSLAAHHRPRSSPQVVRAMGFGMTPMAPASRTVSVIVHFTSLANYKLVKGVLQTVLAPNGSSAARMPEVIVIPKPAGPRRVLTALHTAATKPVVDPFFSPIATSPMSPGLHPPASFFPQTSSPKSPVGRPTSSPRSTSERSARSPKEHPVDGFGAAPPSPLGLSEGMDYFSEAAVKMGTSPSSGLVIQSPDGQPAGIFFHPRPKTRGSRIAAISAENAQFVTLGDGPYRRASDVDDLSKGRYQFLVPPGTSGAGLSRRSSKTAVTIDLGSPEGKDTKSGVTNKGKAPLESPSPAYADMPQSMQSIITPLLPPTPADLPRPPPAPRVITARKPNAVEPLRKNVSPPATPRTGTPNVAASASWKATARRLTLDSKASTPAAAGTTKGKPGDSNIVPPISVLVVDDNPINQTILSTFMKKKRIKYDVAKNGEEAVQKWKSGRFHLILMDIQMPVMDGISATKEIRRLEKLNAFQGYPSTPQSDGQRTPSDAPSSDSRMSTSPYRSSVIIVALTASSLQSDRVAALAAGCNDFLTKPVSLVWLNSKIIEWGSIKALQMWADIRPEVVKTISTGQTKQAENVARRLHVPEGRASPSASPSRSSSHTRTPAPAATHMPTSAPGPSILNPGKGHTRLQPLTVESPVVQSPLSASSEASIATLTPRASDWPVLPVTSSPHKRVERSEPSAPRQTPSAEPNETSLALQDSAAAAEPLDAHASPEKDTTQVADPPTDALSAPGPPSGHIAAPEGRAQREVQQ